jgi:hypothetical protein
VPRLVSIHGPAISCSIHVQILDGRSRTSQLDRNCRFTDSLNRGISFFLIDRAYLDAIQSDALTVLAHGRRSIWHIIAALGAELLEVYFVGDQRSTVGLREGTRHRSGDFSR